MPNPKAPRPGRVRRSSETQPDLAAFTSRLRRLGATDDELALVAEHWDHFDDDWTAEKRAETIRLTDDELRSGLLSARGEFDRATMSDDELAARDRAARWDATLAEVEGRIGSSVAKLLAWIGDDTLRAEAVLQVENEAAQPRRTLIDALAERLSGVAAS